MRLIDHIRGAYLEVSDEVGNKLLNESGYEKATATKAEPVEQVGQTRTSDTKDPVPNKTAAAKGGK